ncbi:hypothetical protein ACWDPI_27135, partial [Streptomyces zhihengii]
MPQDPQLDPPQLEPQLDPELPQLEPEPPQLDPALPQPEPDEPPQPEPPVSPPAPHPPPVSVTPAHHTGTTAAAVAAATYGTAERDAPWRAAAARNPDSSLSGTARVPRDATSSATVGLPVDRATRKATRASRPAGVVRRAAGGRRSGGAVGRVAARAL